MMDQGGGRSHRSRRRRRIWRFAGAEFDESAQELRIGGTAVAIEAKPLQLLYELLLRPGEVITKDELLEAVWPGLTVVEGSLPTAVSKLRKALGESAAPIIQTIPRIGYRLVAEVTVESIESRLPARFDFASGDAVSGRENWLLEKSLGGSGANDVWLARHPKTGGACVFKFADASDRLRALKRECALSRLLHAAIPSGPPIPALHEWNFDHAPYWLEYAYGGPDLHAWAERNGGLGAISPARRLALAATICRAVHEVHSAGVLHKDLKPANILLAEDSPAPLVRLVDFGSGSLLDTGMPDGFIITDPAPLHDAAEDGSYAGTPAYRAPELIGGGTPTVRSDIYALGVIVYQLMVGDFTRTLAPGWAKDIADPILRGDIAEAAAGRTEQRTSSAAILAERLEKLEERRQRARQEEAERQQANRLRRAEERRRARRPFVRAAVASLCIGMLASAAFAFYALDQRDEAITARQMAETGFRFIAEDVLASPDPAHSAADETLLDAIKRASGNISARYDSTPALAGRLHLAIARALQQRSDFDSARAEYARAETSFAAAGLSDSEDAIIGRLYLIQLEAVAGQPGRLELAQQMLAREKEVVAAHPGLVRAAFNFAMAQGAVGYMTDLDVAEAAFRRAIELAEADEASVSPANRIKIRSSLALTLMRQGRVAEAEPLAREAASEAAQLLGADHADTLMTRQHLLQNLAMQGRAEEALQQSAPLLQAMQARFGADHRLTLALHSTRYESAAMLGQFELAASEAHHVWQGAARAYGADSHQALVGKIDFASALCRTSRGNEGLAIAQQAVEATRTAFGPDYPLTHATRFYAGECLLRAGRHEDAAHLLDGLDTDSVAALTGQTQFSALVDLSQAEIAFGRGDLARARELLQNAEAVLRDISSNDIRTRLSDLARLLQV